MHLTGIIRKVSIRQRVAIKRHLFLMVFVVTGLLVSLPVQAQRYLGGLNGTVNDQAGAKIPGAKVVAVEDSTKFKTEVISSAVGAYSIPSLSPGTYTVSVTSKGFKTATEVNVVLTAGQVIQLDFSLSPGNITETVEVAAETASLMDTSSPTVATTLDSPRGERPAQRGPESLCDGDSDTCVVDTASGGYFEGHSSQYTNPYSGVAVQLTAFGSSGHNG